MLTRILSRTKTEKSGGSAEIVIKRSAGGSHWKDPKYNDIRSEISTDKRLGRIPDRDLAREYGVSRAYVGSIRNKAGIKPYVSRSSRSSLISHKIESSPLLGKYRDSDVARHLDTSENYVRTVRNKLGLPVSDKFLPVPFRDLLEGWKCLPEQVGLSKRQWISYVKRLKN